MHEEVMVRDTDANKSVESLNALKQPAKKAEDRHQRNRVRESQN